mmetsp:Transcript_33424/g.94647  ORF Transcript_33424/g.94647 Transcript_33424/m.94647 type:complete len:279 (-) Transcript_33424:654-1490(-)
MAATLITSGCSGALAALRVPGDGRSVPSACPRAAAAARHHRAVNAALPFGNDASKTHSSASLDRRQALMSLPALTLALQMSFSAQAESGSEEAPVDAVVPPLAASAKRKVVVLGGNGFVGSRVCKMLVNAGCEVVSVSRTGAPPSWAAGKEAWVDSVAWTKGDVLSEDIAPVLKGAAAVVSCIGVIGGSYEYMEKGNGAVNVTAAQKAKAAGVPRFVYVSVASIVPDSVSGLVGGTDFKVGPALASCSPAAPPLPVPCLLRLPHLTSLQRPIHFAFLK